MTARTFHSISFPWFSTSIHRHLTTPKSPVECVHGPDQVLNKQHVKQTYYYSNQDILCIGRDIATNYIQHPQSFD